MSKFIGNSLINLIKTNTNDQISKLIKRFVFNNNNNNNSNNNNRIRFNNYEAVLNQNEIILSNNDKKLSKNYPYIWLRDNCKCSKCYNYVADEIEIEINKICDNLKPIEIKEYESNSSKYLSIKWDDGHISEYDIKKLINYALSNEVQEKKEKREKKYLWNRELLFKDNKNGIETFDYEDYLNNDLILSKCLSSVKKYGAAILNGVPANEKEILKVCKRIGPVQNSHFGGDCVVTNSLEFSDRAYTNLNLKAHTDTAYLKNSAGIEMFHVIKKAEKGGRSLLVDGFYCANKLKEQSENDFNILSSTKVESQFYKQDSFDLKYFDSIIKLDAKNNKDLYQIRFNPYNKLNLIHLNSEQIKQFYKAFRNFINIIENEQNELWLSLREDQVLMFDNFRLLHGREQFSGERCLITVYLSRDDWLSKASILEQQQKQQQ